MTRQDFKPVYAKNNNDWRIRYASNGNWELQEFRQLVEGIDRRCFQPWYTHHGRMSYDDAMQMLSSHDIVLRKSV